MVAGAAGGRRSVIVVVDIAGTGEVAVCSEAVGGTSEARASVGNPASGTAVAASFASAERGIEGHGGGTGAEVAGVDDLQSRCHAGSAAGVVDAGEARGVAGRAGGHAILEKSCPAGAVSRAVSGSVHRGVAGQAVRAGSRAGPAPAVAFGTELYSCGGLVVASHAEAKPGRSVVGSKGGGVAGEANSGGEAGEAARVAGGAGCSSCVEVSVHAYAEWADAGQ